MAAAVLGASGCGGQRSKTARLQPVPADAIRARAALLMSDQLPRRFHRFERIGPVTRMFASPIDSLSACRASQPDLSGLTETAGVIDTGLTNTYSGDYYFPSVHVFASSGDAERAIDLLSGATAYPCEVAITKKRLQVVDARVTGQSLNFVRQHKDGVDIRARQAILRAKAAAYSFRVETSAIYLRRGRALSEIWTSGPWNAATRRTWNAAVSAAARDLARSGF